MRRVRQRHSNWIIPAAGVCALALLSAGCSSSGGAFGSAASEPQSSSQQSFTDRFSRMLSGGSSASASTTTASAVTSGESEVPSYCPVVDVRQGAATLSVTAAKPKNPEEAATMSLRYQGTIGQTARECLIVGGNLTMKVGVQGRLILGPEGGPGEIEVPLRYALIQEGPEPKTIWTKLYRFPVAIGEGQASMPFTHVQEDIVVPRPKGIDLESYVVYIGFDTLAMKPPPAKKPPAKKR